MTNMKTKNIDSIDLTKFLLSFCVVAIHTSFLNEYIFPYVRLAVPIFFIFSGYLTFLKFDSIQENKLKWKKLFAVVKRYLMLYMFWFIVLLPHTLYIRRYFSNGIFQGILTLVKNFFLDSTFRASWYIMATMLGIVIIFCLSRFISNGGLLFITSFAYLFSTAYTEFSYELNLHAGIETFLETYTRYLGIPCYNFMIALIYIVLGKILAENRTKNIKPKRNIVFFIVCFLGLICEYYIRLKSGNFIYSCDCYIMLAPTAYFIVTIVLNIKANIKYAKVFSKLSTIIYCSHIPISLLVLKGVQLCNIEDPMNIINYVLTLIVSICLGLLILKLEKFRPLRFLKYSH